MAERVEANVELFVRDAEILLNLEIYSQEHIQKLIKNINDFEYSINKRVKKSDDFEKYINHELEFYNDLSQTTSSLETAIKSAILFAHQKRIHFLFNRALEVFKDHPRLWQLHFEFCIKTENYSKLEFSLSKYINFHASDPNVWCVAADSYSQFDMEMANKILDRAISLHPTSIAVIHKYFQNLITFNTPSIVEISSKFIQILQNLVVTVLEASDDKSLMKQCVVCFTQRYCVDDLISNLFSSFCANFTPRVTLHLVLCFCELNAQLARDYMEILIEQSPELIFVMLDALVTNNHDLININDWRKLFDNLNMEYDQLTEQQVEILAVFLQHYKLEINQKLCDQIICGEKWGSFYALLKTVHLHGKRRDSIRIIRTAFRIFPNKKSKICKCLSTLVETTNKKSFSKYCINFMSKHQPTLILKHVASLWKLLIRQLGGKKMLRLISKYINISGIDFKLITSFVQLQMNSKVVNMTLSRMVMEKYISTHSKIHVDFWITYISLERYNANICSDYTFTEIDPIYKRALHNLRDCDLDEFQRKFALLLVV